MHQPYESSWCDVDEAEDDTLSRAHDKVSEQYCYSLPPRQTGGATVVRST